MKKLLISIDYRDNRGKFWFDSSIKNRIVNLDTNENIHVLIKNLCEEEGMELSYKGKPQGNIFIDTQDKPKIVGYFYRGKSEIYDRGMSKPLYVLFDVWVNIHEVIDYTFEEINV